MLLLVTYTQDLGYWQENHVFRSEKRCSRVGIPFVRLIFLSLKEFSRSRLVPMTSFRLPRSSSENYFRGVSASHDMVAPSE
jgi:hypothetical protein